MNIRHAIIPAAGMGTRFLPITKTLPKEMLPLFNKPAIEFIVQECVESHIDTIHCIVSETKDALRAYLSPNQQLNATLEQLGKAQTLDSIDQLLQQTQINFINQDSPKGLGHAVFMARAALAGHDFFGILLPDDLMFGTKPALGQLMALAEQHNGMVIAVQEVPLEATSAYGIVAIDQEISEGFFKVKKLVEKPSPEHAPSRWGIIGRYVLSSALFPVLENMAANHVRGEIQLTDAIDYLVAQGHPVYAYQVKSTRYDIGTPNGWLSAIVGYAHNNPLYAPVLQKILADIAANQR